MLFRVTSVRENQGESANFKVPFSNQGKSGEIDLFGENRGKIREFHYESGEKIREFRYSVYSFFFRIPKNISPAPSAVAFYEYFFNILARAVDARI